MKALYSMVEKNNKDLNKEHEILQAVRGVRYGTVEIIIHDSKVVQIERTEKIRFKSTASE